MGKQEDRKRLERRLAELRGLLGRIEQHHLEPGDWALVDALLSEEIDEAEETGQELLLVGPEEDAPGGKTGEAAGAEDEAKGGAHDGSTTPDPTR